MHGVIRKMQGAMLQLQRMNENVTKLIYLLQNVFLNHEFVFEEMEIMHK